MSWLPQFVGISDQTNGDPSVGSVSNMLAIVNVSTIPVQGCGTGFVAGDVGRTVLINGGTHTVQAKCVITSVAGGKVTGVALTDPGNYSAWGSSGSTTGTVPGSVGTGLNLTVVLLGTPLLLRQGQCGFPGSMTGMTVSLWYTHEMMGVFHFFYPINDFFSGAYFGGGGGLTRRFFYLWDNTGHRIMYADWNEVSIPTGPTTAKHVLCSIDISSQTFQCYFNDTPVQLFENNWYNITPVLNPTSAAWAVANDPGGNNAGATALGALWVRDGFTDLNNVAFRRQFINADLSPVDPATYPPAQINLYTQPGDSPNAFATNHGTGGTFNLVNGPFNWAHINGPFWPGPWEPYILMWYPEFKILERTSISDCLKGSINDTGAYKQGNKDYTSRPFADLTYVGIVDQPTNGVVTLDANGNFTYTPNHDFLSGNDSFSYTVKEVMPAPCQQPAYTELGVVQIEVAMLDSTWIIDAGDTKQEGGAGNVWADQSYVNFSDPDVRSKFVTSAGDWVDVQREGELPLGYSPLLYLTVQIENSDDAWDFTYGYGQNSGQSGWDLFYSGINPATGVCYPQDPVFDDCSVAIIIVPPHHLHAADYTFTVSQFKPFIGSAATNTTDDATNLAYLEYGPSGIIEFGGGRLTVDIGGGFTFTPVIGFQTSSVDYTVREILKDGSVGLTDTGTITFIPLTVPLSPGETDEFCACPPCEVLSLCRPCDTFSMRPGRKC